MDRKTIMIKPDITSMVMKDKSGYLYYVARNLHIYDLKNGRMIQTLPGTYNSSIAVSSDGTLLVCVHPVRTSTEMIFYHVDGTLTEDRRVIIHSPISVFDPAVSCDNRFAFFCGDDNSIWKAAVSSGDPKCIFRCRENEIITSIDVNDQDILISVYDISGNCHNCFVLLLDHDGTVKKKYGFIVSYLNDLKLRNIGCIRISDTSFACLLRIHTEDELRSSLQTVSLSGSDHIEADHMQIHLDFDFCPYMVRVTDDLKFFALGGTAPKTAGNKRVAAVYSLPDFETRIFEYYDRLWSLGFSKDPSGLLVCSEKQHFIELS